MMESDRRDGRAEELRGLAGLFLKLGATAFGGPAVHIALFEHEVVTRRQWLTQAEFLDLLGAANLIPGPNSTELAIHIGLRRAGWPGLLVAGACFIVPAFLIVLAIAWFYTRYAQVPQLQWVLYGVKPVVLAIVIQALWRLAPKAASSTSLRVVAAGAFTAGLLGVHELLLLLLGGGVMLAVSVWRQPPGPMATVRVHGLLPWCPAALLASAGPTVGVGAGVGLAKLFLFFLKVGAVLYGSGYVLLAFLRADLVERWGWLTEAQLLDAVAIGQITPGPLFTTATFIGYVLAGGWGAVLATVGIFLPAFVFVAISAPLLPRIRASRRASAFLDGVNAAALALMAAVTVQLLGAALVDGVTIALGAVAAGMLLWTRINPMALIVAAGAMGWLLTR